MGEQEPPNTITSEGWAPQDPRPLPDVQRYPVVPRYPKDGTPIGWGLTAIAWFFLLVGLGAWLRKRWPDLWKTPVPSDDGTDGAEVNATRLRQPQRAKETTDDEPDIAT